MVAAQQRGGMQPGIVVRLPVPLTRRRAQEVVIRAQRPAYAGRSTYTAEAIPRRSAAREVDRPGAIAFHAVEEAAVSA